jgi:hypothetical protein
MTGHLLLIVAVIAEEIVPHNMTQLTFSLKTPNP